jgi:hypothetical protein
MNCFRYCRDSYEVELSGGYVKLFREMMKDIGLGLPVVVLQWVKVTTDQGFFLYSFNGFFVAILCICM